MKGSDVVPEKEVRVTHSCEETGQAGARAFWCNSPGGETQMTRGQSELLGWAGESPSMALGRRGVTQHGLRPDGDGDGGIGGPEGQSQHSAQGGLGSCSMRQGRPKQDLWGPVRASQAEMKGPAFMWV